ncbi:exportin 7 [Trichuris trichiura]|uniref:Exportin 7 n=1 Tax=Trichuris trichiura TaxID=36087 RepID=A0A077ZHC8_TRITR|nr:exportin 7 [Trichuris trichiura]
MALSESDLQYFDAICQELLQATDNEKRYAADKALSEFCKRPEVFANVHLLLERTLFCRLVKVSWFNFDSDGEMQFQVAVKRVIELNEGSMESCSIAVELLRSLVLEMGQLDQSCLVGRQLKVAASFRDIYLLDIYKVSIGLLKSVAENVISFNVEDTDQRSLLVGVLALSLACLSFEFASSRGTDERDESIVVLIPSSWRDVFFSFDVIKLYHTIYMHIPVVEELALNCLVQVASIRRTLFDCKKRTEMLLEMMESVIEMLSSNRVPSAPETSHHFCLLLCRLKNTHQLSEFTGASCFDKFVDKTADFSVKSFMTVDFPPGGLHYLLAYWDLMISCLAYFRDGKNKQALEKAASIITRAFIESRLERVDVLQENAVRELNDFTLLWDQMDQFSTFCRYHYASSAEWLLQSFDQLVGAYNMSFTQQSESVQTSIVESKLVWTLYMIGSAISGRSHSVASSGNDSKDGEMICRVLQLIRVTGSTQSQRRFSNIMEMAYLWFLHQFRKTYLSDNSANSTDVCEQISRSLGLPEGNSVLSVVLDKVLHNLKTFVGHEDLILHSIELLKGMSMGYKASKTLLSLPQMQYVVANHSLDQFLALSRDGDLKTLKLRTALYETLVSMVCYVSDEELSDRLKQFLRPLTVAIDGLYDVISVNDSSLFFQEGSKKAVTALARDLRGVFASLSTKQAYGTAFELIYPRCFQVFLRACEVSDYPFIPSGMFNPFDCQLWYMDSSVVSPILRFCIEIGTNRSQRVQYSLSVPTGYLLARDFSKLITVYGSRLLPTTGIPQEHIYNIRYKGMMLCFAMLRSIFTGNCINFGVFSLYGDSSIDDALRMFFEMALDIGREQFLVYPKLAKTYHDFLEALVQDYVVFVTNLKPDVLVYVLQTLLDGVNSPNTDIVIPACATVDKVVSHMYQRYYGVGGEAISVTSGLMENDNSLKVIREKPQVLQEVVTKQWKVPFVVRQIPFKILSSLLNAVLFDECRCHYSMSRPILGLILLLEDYYSRLKLQLIVSLPPSQQNFVSELMDELTKLPRNLYAANKDECVYGIQAIFVPANSLDSLQMCPPFASSLSSSQRRLPFLRT